MSFTDLALNHVSIRNYKTDPIQDDVLSKILECGLRSSSSGNMQSWSVIKSTDQAQRERLFKYHMEQKMILQAPLVLTFCADFHRMGRWLKLREAKPSFDDLSGFLVAAFDAVIASQSIALAAESQGLGICYMGTTLWCAADLIREFELPLGVIPVTSLVMGYPNETPPTRDRLPLSAMVHDGGYRKYSDADILEIYREREVKGWQRYHSLAPKEFMDQLAAEGITDLAKFYTSDHKYAKCAFARFAKEYLAALQSQGFWNF